MPAYHLHKWMDILISTYAASARRSMACAVKFYFVTRSLKKRSLVKNQKKYIHRSIYKLMYLYVYKFVLFHVYFSSHNLSICYDIQSRKILRK